MKNSELLKKLVQCRHQLDEVIERVNKRPPETSELEAETNGILLNPPEWPVEDYLLLVFGRDNVDLYVEALRQAKLR